MKNIGQYKVVSTITTNTHNSDIQIQYSDSTTDTTQDKTINTGDIINTDNTGNIFQPITGTTSGTLTIGSTGTSSTHFTFPPRGHNVFDEKPNAIIGKCSKCNTEGVMEKTWGWNDNEKLQRYICKECECKRLDKKYKLDRNISTEKVLYKKGEPNE